MSADVLKRFAVGGALRPDTFSGMNPQFTSALGQMFAAAPPEIQAQMRVTSGYRSPERQAQLWQGALAKYGSPEAARKWVAPPGKSQHNHGHAADMKWLSPMAMQWAHANAAKYGLAFPLKNENWHVELAGVRGGMPKTQNPPTSAVTALPTQVLAQPPAPVGDSPLDGLGGTSLANAFLGAADAFAQPQANDAERAAAERQRKIALFGGDLYS
jgi:hypothetical protein